MSAPQLSGQVKLLSCHYTQVGITRSPSGVLHFKPTATEMLMGSVSVLPNLGRRIRSATIGDDQKVYLSSIVGHAVMLHHHHHQQIA